MSTPAPTELTPLHLVRKWLREHVDEGVECPCCTQNAKVYRRKLNSGMAYALIAMYRHGRTDWLHKPTVLRGLGAGARDESLLRFWGLTEEETEQRPDGGRSGWWRVTEKGEAFVRGRVSVPQYGYFYSQRCLGLQGREVWVQDCLGERFNYAELMAGV